LREELTGRRLALHGAAVEALELTELPIDTDERLLQEHFRDRVLRIGIDSRDQGIGLRIQIRGDGAGEIDGGKVGGDLLVSGLVSRFRGVVDAQFQLRGLLGVARG
jgi:hypothetical protein